jgi:hypothetical protein
MNIYDIYQELAALKSRQPRKPGNCKGMITLLVEDDEHLEFLASS